jgi:hypothetical protein
LITRSPKAKTPAEQYETTTAATPTCLDNVDANVLYASINLLLHKRSGYDVDVLDAQRVLRRQRRRGRHRVTAVGRHDFLVCLETAVAKQAET